VKRITCETVTANIANGERCFTGNLYSRLAVSTFSSSLDVGRRQKTPGGQSHWWTEKKKRMEKERTTED